MNPFERHIAYFQKDLERIDARLKILNRMVEVLESESPLSLETEREVRWWLEHLEVNADSHLLLSATTEEIQSADPAVQERIQKIFAHNQRIFDHVAAIRRGENPAPLEFGENQ